MQSRIDRVLTILGAMLAFSALFILTGCTQESAPQQPHQNPALSPGSASSQNGPGKITNPEVRKELASVRAATAKYHDVETAEAEGYVAPPPSDFVPGMGYHYVNLALAMDGEIDLTQPEVLVYAPHPKKDSRKLVAVEYLMPILTDSPPPAPEGFTGDQDHWHVLPSDESGAPVDFWAMHAWIWEHNPEGMFNETNPRIGTTP